MAYTDKYDEVQIEQGCESEQYKKLCQELHQKYAPNTNIDDGCRDYPEEYWDEFNPKFEQILKEMFPTT